MKRKVGILAVIGFVAIFMCAACSSDKGPAELALKAAEEAINAVKGEAVKYIPDQVKSIEDALAAAKEKFGKKDYKAALEEAKGIADKAKGLVAAAKAKQEELTKDWTDLNEGLPKMVDAIQSKVDALSKLKKLPKELTAEKLEEVKTGFAAAKEKWTKALENFKAGSVADAVAAGNAVKEKATTFMEALGIAAPAAEPKK